MISQGQARVPGPVQRIERRTSLAGQRCPQPDVLKNRVYYDRILDSSAITRIGPLHGSNTIPRSALGARSDRECAAQQLQPLGSRHHLEVALHSPTCIFER